MLERTIQHVGGRRLLLINQIWRRFLIDGRDMPQKTEFETRLWRRNSTSGYNFNMCFATGPSYVWPNKISAKRRTDRRLVPMLHWQDLLSQWAKSSSSSSSCGLSGAGRCRSHKRAPGLTFCAGGTLLPIANLMADSEWQNREARIHILVS